MYFQSKQRTEVLPFNVGLNAKDHYFIHRHTRVFIVIRNLLFKRDLLKMNLNSWYKTYIKPVHNINMAVSLLVLVNLMWYEWNNFGCFVETHE